MNNQIDPLALANLIITSIIAICALYLAYAALKHAATPNVRVSMSTPKTLQCNETILFVFEFTNIGYWYAKPPAINMIVFCNFAPEFKLVELRYGSSQAYADTDAKIGVGKMVYLKAKGLKLIYGQEAEEVHVKAITPAVEGEYGIRISGFSDNGVNIRKEFAIRCENPQASNSR
ncbi:MAG: hypothetical protein JW892_04185 [Anaerolineae bacterium]|nr:hypothetical protein [Anaerolineae bacterium]